MKENVEWSERLHEIRKIFARRKTIELKPTIQAEKVDLLEQTYGFQLSEEYRAFITTVGNGATLQPISNDCDELRPFANSPNLALTAKPGQCQRHSAIRPTNREIVRRDGRRWWAFSWSGKKHCTLIYSLKGSKHKISHAVWIHIAWEILPIKKDCSGLIPEQPFSVWTAPCRSPAIPCKASGCPFR